MQDCNVLNPIGSNPFSSSPSFTNPCISSKLPPPADKNAQI
jgi:hypothetical protein